MVEVGCLMADYGRGLIHHIRFPLSLPCRTCLPARRARITTSGCTIRDGDSDKDINYCPSNGGGTCYIKVYILDIRVVQTC